MQNKQINLYYKLKESLIWNEKKGSFQSLRLYRSSFQKKEKKKKNNLAQLLSEEIQRPIVSNCTCSRELWTIVFWLRDGETISPRFPPYFPSSVPSPGWTFRLATNDSRNSVNSTTAGNKVNRSMCRSSPRGANGVESPALAAGEKICSCGGKFPQRTVEFWKFLARFVLFFVRFVSPSEASSVPGNAGNEQQDTHPTGLRPERSERLFLSPLSKRSLLRGAAVTRSIFISKSFTLANGIDGQLESSGYRAPPQ
mgnify:CR=1 FL=1